MKKLVCFLVTMAVCVGAVGCGGTKYEDTNGADNYALQTITDENIIHLETGASGLSYSETDMGGVLSSSEYSSKNFNGVEQIFLTNYIFPSDVQVYIGTMNVKEGNFKLVAVLNDEIIQEFPLDTFNEIFTFEDMEGAFSIHVAGESAAFEFYLEVM